jgi:exonuclease III
VHAAFGPSNARGAAIVARKQNDMIPGDIWEDRITTGVAETAIGKTNIVNIYAPNVSKAKKTHEDYVMFMSGLDQILAAMSGPIILAGDLNIIMDPVLDTDRPNPASYYQDLVDEWERLMRKYNLFDAFRQLHPDERAFTFAPGGENVRKIFRRLDYILCSKEVLDSLESLTMRTTALSDHKSLILTLRHKTVQPPYKMWKLKTELLKDPEVVESIRLAIKTAEAEAKTDELGHQAQWEYVKYKARQRARAEEKRIFKTEKADKKRWQALVDRHFADPNRAREVNEARANLVRLETEETNRLIEASKVKWAEENEKSTTFFFNRLKQAKFDSNIMTLCKDNTELTPKEINEEVHRYYSDLFQKRPVEGIEGSWADRVEEMRNDIGNAANDMARPITIKEVEWAVFKKWRRRNHLATMASRLNFTRPSGRMLKT